MVDGIENGLIDDRAERRVTRLLHDAKLPKDKTLATCDLNRYAAPFRGQIKELLHGEFLAGLPMSA